MHKKNLGYIIVFSIILIACLWAFISAGIITRNFKAKIDKDDMSKKAVDISNLLVTETKDGGKMWELFADTGHYDSNNNVVLLNDIIGNFYNKGKVVASFHSSQGTYNSEKKQVVLYHKTIIVYKDGTNVTADRIIWTGKDKHIQATGNFKLEKPNQVIITGQKAVLTDDLSDFKLIGKTKTKIYGKGKPL